MTPSKLTALAALSLASLLISSRQASAGVNFVAPGVAGSVTNLTVGGDVYDVAFAGNISHASWVNQLDFSSEAEAQAAIVALAAELNAAGATTARFTTPGGTFDFTTGQLWYDADATTLYGETLIRSGSNWQLANPGPGGSNAPINGAFPLALDFTLVSVSPWIDLGGGTTGVGGPPTLTMSGPLTAGSTLHLDLVDAAPSALAVVFISISSTPASFLGGTLHAFPFVDQILVGTDLSGGISGGIVFPGAPPGTQFWFQVGIVDASVPLYGASLSNAEVGTTP